MRRNSKKQTAASRINGGKSPGPKSAEGKAKSRLNALKNGLFSTDLVVTAAGESVQDFESFKAAVWESVQPEGALQEMLTDDLVANWWRRQRVRRSESAETRSRLEALTLHHTHLRSDEIEPLILKFSLLLGRHRPLPNTPDEDVIGIRRELEEVRSQLASTSLGLQFFSRIVSALRYEAESTGQLSDASMVALGACGGGTNEQVQDVKYVWKKNRAQSEKLAERACAERRGGNGHTKEVEPEKGKGKRNAGKEEADGWTEAGGSTVLIDAIDIVARELSARKQVIEAIEKWQEKARFAAAILPTDSTGDRFHRAETAFDRRLYRALAALLTLKHATNASKLLP